MTNDIYRKRNDTEAINRLTDVYLWQKVIPPASLEVESVSGVAGLFLTKLRID